MSLQKLNIILMSSLLAIVLAGCGSGFSSDDGPLLDQGSSSTGDGDSGSNTPPASSDFLKIDLTGFISGGAYNRVWTFNLDKTNNALFMNIPVPGNPALNFISAIAQISGGVIKGYQDTQQKSFVALSIPLKHVVKTSSLPAARLPNGDALPSMPSASAPALGLDLGEGIEQKAYVYFGTNAVGLYIESSYIPSTGGMTLPIKNDAGTRIMGYFTTVTQKGSSKGGLFVTLLISSEIAKILSDRVNQLP